MSRRRRIRRTHRKSQPQSPSLPRTCVSGVWHRMLRLAAESEGSARGYKWANKLPTGEHTHTPSVKRSIFKECLLRAASHRIQYSPHRSSSSSPRPHLGSSPGAAPRGAGRVVPFGQGFSTSNPPEIPTRVPLLSTKDPRATPHPGFLKNFQTRVSGFATTLPELGLPTSPTPNSPLIATLALPKATGTPRRLAHSAAAPAGPRRPPAPLTPPHLSGAA